MRLYATYSTIQMSGSRGGVSERRIQSLTLCQEFVKVIHTVLNHFSLFIINQSTDQTNKEGLKIEMKFGIVDCPVHKNQKTEHQRHCESKTRSLKLHVFFPQHFAKATTFV